ncbi:MAG: 3,4-dihydroxy-2-butanone-4-phosphate synthase [Planctomycetes bacterium]|nr:3,4-dihydroxy-2-butanone-4-phosphate synthase [Planctomycetota bacterium]
MPNAQDFVSIEDALAELKAGRMIVLVDDEERENEGDLVIPAEHATPESINFMMRNACGIVCLAMSRTICERLHLDVVASGSPETQTTPFTLQIDARFGITTGTSAFDRARTVAVAIDDNATPNDLVRGKGHVFGLRAKDGGVLVRAGHTEGSVDLARLAGFKEAAVICEIVHPDGTMARLPYLREFCQQHQIKMCSIEDLIKYRRQRERLIHREFVVKLPTRFGEFDLIPYTSVVDPEPHLALCMGGVGIEADGVVPVQAEPIIVRIHSQCLTGDILGSMLCDCGPQLHQAMAQVAQAGKGVVLYMRQEGRGIGLLPKLKAYKLQQEEQLDTVEANKALGFAPDLRQYGIGAQILFDLGVRDIRLLTNNPRKVVGLDGYGLRIVESLPIKVEPNQHNARYLKTKKDKLGHLLDDVE